MNAGRSLPVVCSIAALVACLPVCAQVQVGANTEVRLGADASVGYVASSAQGGLNSINFSLGADLRGHYYHPGFLQFAFSPYYNQGREYSTADFISGDKGLSTSLNLFSGSNIPFFLTYSKSVTRSGLYGVVGSEASVVGAGSNQNLNLNWSLRLRRLPFVQLGYIRSSGDYRVFGANDSFGKADTKGYVIGAQYNLLGFSLTGSFNRQRFQQQLPQVLSATQPQALTTTHQNNMQFSANRRITKASFFDLSATRSRWSTDITSQPQNRSYDTVHAGLTARPLQRLSAGLRANYTSDLSALLLGSVLPGAVGNPAPTGKFPVGSLETQSRYVTYSTYATYELKGGLSARTSLRHGDGRFSARANSTDTSWDTSVMFSRSFHGLRMSTGYTNGLYDFRNGGVQTSSQGHTGNLNLSKPIHGWNYSTLFQYSTANIDALLPGNLHSLTTEVSASGAVKSWRLVSSYRFERSDSIFDTRSENRRQGMRVSLSRNRLNLGATVQFASGLSILSVSGPRAASVAQAAAASSQFEHLLIPSESSSISFNGSYQFGRRSTLSGSFSRLHYRTIQAGAYRENQLDQYDFHVRHWYRRLDLRAGFRRYHQQFSGFNGLYNANTVYFQVSRHFDVF